ncbi:hypothetical protein L873DRAFT_676045 [Choiromyces venosus 120613-1]|uniref:Uncharacterized protein n=1 Tax=Choiromyces venosus 120613-1 TaxID=1336337 RepID=A0A3N4K5Y1_9PEZI|nr:hypothetical protein L873DRAFT_676045 [Choiromyces venosus 120613-1]
MILADLKSIRKSERQTFQNLTQPASLGAQTSGYFRNRLVGNLSSSIFTLSYTHLRSNDWTIIKEQLVRATPLFLHLLEIL